MTTPYDVEKVRAGFPVLHQEVHGKPLAYLDNAATSQKPEVVIEAMKHYYEADNANVHRGVHQLSERATRDYEDARAKVQRFMNAASSKEVVFVRGTTEAINLVAYSFVRPLVGKGDEVLITAMEHHSNIVPWQILCEETGATLRVAPINDDGALDMEAFSVLLSDKTRFVSVTHVSNALGTVNPVREIVRLSHEKGVPVMVDGAQAAPHIPIDVRAIDADFYAISSHKMYGPTGVGALYGKESLLETMRPYQGGGDMIKSVTFEKTVYNDLPYRFEAGTPNISGAIGFGAAVDYLEGLGLEAVAAHEDALVSYCTERLLTVPGVRIIGTAPDKASVVSFTLEGVHPHDIGTLLDLEGVAVRTGHHCAQPVMERFGVPATCRASFGVYNTTAEIDRLVEAVKKVKEVFG
ncbi:MAG: cysteine desulfurase [Euryarchaeota archaeon]|nr:cysteine desulfurase [Euryarchaeota archaeon]